MLNRPLTRTSHGATIAQGPQQLNCQANSRMNECPCVSIDRYVCDAATSDRNTAAAAAASEIRVDVVI
jgi:hypothetical protein